MAEAFVWKYELEVAGAQEIEMPSGAELLYAGDQPDPDDPPRDAYRHRVTIWARVVPSRPIAKRRILIRDTGHPSATSRMSER